MERLDVFEYPVFAMINDVFDLPHRKIKFFRKPLIRDPVQKTTFENSTVSLSVAAYGPFIDELLYLCS